MPETTSKNMGEKIVNLFKIEDSKRRSLLTSLGKKQGSNLSESVSYSYRPDRVKLSGRHERTIIASIINRISMDVAAINLLHAVVDEDGTYLETLPSNLNECLTTSANIDQTAKAFIQDVIMTMLDEGVVAVVPVDWDISTGVKDISSLRVGKIRAWLPRHVKVNIYNDRTGKREDVMVAKEDVAIMENPMYSIMNEPNSTARRLAEKLALIDAADKKANSGKLDIIIQLPYVVKSDARKKQAKERMENMQEQLENNAYGVAYADATEKITQLNRPAENTLQQQIEYLTSMLYSQLGMPEEVFKGTADEKVLVAYHTRTIAPLLKLLCDTFKIAFLGRERRMDGETIIYVRDPFELLTAAEISEIADKFTRNEIMSSNELRAKIGMKQSDQPGADDLRNKNLNKETGGMENNAEEQPEEV